MRRRHVIAFLFLSAAALAVQAQSYGPGRMHGAGPYQAAADTPEALVRGAIAQLVTFTRSGASDDRMATIAFLEREMARDVDFDAMTRSAAGPLYRRMDTAQRNEVRSRIKEHFLSTLAGGLSGYDLRNIRVVANLGSRRRGHDASVSVYLRQPRGPATRLDFRFYRSRSGWKVYDVAANGRSATLYYRGLIRRTSGRRYL
jgi:phospholipid transport system substrate-binding protein